jgi:hypothetical protein
MLCITGSVVLAACQKQAPPPQAGSDWGDDATAGASPSPSPTPTRYSWYHPFYYFGRFGGGSGSGITDGSRNPSQSGPARGGFGSHGSSSGGS